MREPNTWKVVATSEDRLPFNPEKALISYILIHSTRVSPNTQFNLVRQSMLLKLRLDQLYRSQMIFAGTFEQPGSTHILGRGDPA